MYKTYNAKFIFYINTKISLKNNITYWARVNNQWKRIAKIYFFLLQQMGIKHFDSQNVVSKELPFSNLSLTLTKSLSKEEKKKYGIFFTSSLLVNIILKHLKAILLKCNLRVYRVLEPSCGSGEILLGLNNFFSNLHIVAFEYNNVIYNKVKDCLFTNNFLNVKNQNFLTYFDKEGFDLIIGNPPFNLIKKSDNFNTLGKPINLCALFLLHSLNQLKDNGILVFILPMNFLTSASYNEIRVTLKKNYKILHVLGDLNNSFFLGTAIETCVLFLQKKKSKSNKFVVTFGSSLIFSVYFKRLNQLLSEGQSLKNLGFTITMGSFLKSNKSKLVNGVRGYLICDSNINKDNKLILDDTDIVYSDKLKKDPCIIIFRGYGNAKYLFKYALVNIDQGYIIENHLLVIKQVGNVPLIELMEKLKNKKTLEFINLLFYNQSITTKELALLPLF